MQGFRHIAVGLHRAPTDAALVRYAATVARLARPSEVRFVHVLPRDSSAAPPAPEHDQVQRELEARVREEFVGVPGEPRVLCDVLKGPPLDRLLEFTAEQEVDLLVVGHRHDHPVSQSLARRLAMKAPCSVWMVPDDAAPKLDRLLVPTDFSDHAADTMRVALELARLHGHSEILALHVYFDEARVTYEDARAVLRGHEREAFDHFMAPLGAQGVKVAPLFVEGSHPADTIGRVAEERGANLIVMATRGRSRSAAVLLGSVTEGVLLHAHTPVFVVKHFGAQMSFLQALLDKVRSKKGPQFD